MHDVFTWLAGGAFSLAFASFLLAAWACYKMTSEIAALEALKQINANMRERCVGLESTLNLLQRELAAHEKRLQRELSSLGMEPGVYREEIDKEAGMAKWVKSTELENLWDASGRQMGAFKQAVSAVDIARQ